ncbi:hypothetical protein DFH27DRAFT_267410 [Peziza echinospora]|nr:hypothetical protein DFH27DRAFT_267410 [Peziza echinospora]
MKITFGCASSLFALALAGGRLASATTVCPKYNPSAPVVAFGEEIKGLSEGYFVLPFRGQELVLHVELLPSGGQRKEEEEEEGDTQLNRVRINGVPLGRGIGSPKIPRTTISVPLLPATKSGQEETPHITSSVIQSAFEAKKGSWVEADVVAQLRQDCSRGTADCVSILHLAVLATDETPQENCGGSGNGKKGRKVGSTYASGLVDVSFTEGSKPSLRLVKKAFVSPAGDKWVLTHPKVAEIGKYVHKLDRNAFALDAPDYFKRLSEKLADGRDRSNFKFLVNFIPVDPFHNMAGYIWSYSYRYTFGEAFTRKQTVLSTIEPNPSNTHPSYPIHEPNREIESAHTQGQYTVPDPDEKSTVFFTSKLRKAETRDFHDGRTRTEDQLVGFMVQEVNISKIVSNGFTWTPPYTPYGWEFLTHRLVQDGGWGDSQTADAPFEVQVRPYPDPNAPPPKPAAELDLLARMEEALYGMWVFTRDYAAPAALIGLLTLMFFYGFKFGPWAAGWTWRRLKGQSAYEEGDAEESSDEEGDEGYEVGSTEGVMLDYLVAVDDSKKAVAGRGGVRDRRRAK